MLAGIYAPSAGNLQPWDFYCYRSQDTLKIIKSISPGILGNPKAIVVACINEQKLTKVGLKNWYENAIIDTSMACQNMMLRAFELGVGSCAVTSFDADSLRKLLALPEGRKPILLIIFGYYEELPPAPKRDESVIHIEDEEDQQNDQVGATEKAIFFLLDLLGFLISSTRLGSKEPVNYSPMRLLEASIKIVDQLSQFIPEKSDTLLQMRSHLDEAVSLCFQNNPEYEVYLSKVINSYILLRN